MSLPKHTFKMLKCHFTQEEMTEFRDKLANSIQDDDELDPELDAKIRHGQKELYGKDRTQEDDGVEYWLNRDYFQSAIEEYAETADEGRNIIKAFEDRLNQLQRAAGVTPVCGRIDEKLIRGFSTLTKKEITAICKEVSKADPGVGMIHTEIIEQWPRLKERFDELLTAERQDLIEDSDEETEN